MTIKMMGAMLIIGACGLFGFSIAASSRREESALRELIAALDYMACELQYRLTPLPELCRLAGVECKKGTGKVLLQLAEELESQISPDVESCMNIALKSGSDQPRLVTEAFRLLGSSLGRFDVEGQMNGLESVRSFCRRELEAMSLNRDARLRSYQTLSLCAGAALAILFV